MILGGNFYYQGLLRWNLGWPTPNYAGAFIATLLALAFALSGSRWRWAALAVEVGGLFLLAKTYSRGAVVAWVTAWMFAVVVGRVWREREQVWLWGMRVVVLGVMLWAVGFGWSRAGSVGVTGVKVRAEQMQNTGGTPVPLSDGASASDGPTFGNTEGGRPESRAGGASASDGPTANQDRSVVNRLALWRGGAAMIAAAPWTGWGAGESGRIYMNWFQDVDRTEGFTTMVNSFLHVGVEYGLGVLAAVVAGLGAVLALAWQVGRGEGEGSEGGVYRSGTLWTTRLTSAAGASLVAWAVADFFTTLWIDWKLWIVPGLATGIMVWQVLRGRSILPVGLLLRRAMWFGVVSALAVTFGLWFTGSFLAARSTNHIQPGADGAISVRARAAPVSEKIVWHVWPDPAVLGPTPGKELRRWRATLPASPQWVVHRADAAVKWNDPSDDTGVILMGRQAERLLIDGALGSRPLRVVHPLGAPPSGPVNSAGSAELILPAIDEAGNGMAWRAWAAGSGARVSVSRGVGLDIRAAWPVAVLSGGGR